MDNSIHNEKGAFIIKASARITIAISIFSFLVFYIPESFRYSIDEWILYLSYFIRSFISSFLPALAAAAVFYTSKHTSYIKRILPSLSLAFPRLFYLLPYNYLRYMAEAYDSLESLTLMLIRSTVEILIYAVEIYVYALVADLLFRTRGKGENLFDVHPIFDFSKTANYAVFMIAFSRFAVDFITEVIDVISYIIEYGETYRIGEIYFMIGSFLFILLTLILSYTLVIFIKHKSLKKYEKIFLFDEEA